ncbi:ROK family protein [Vagococcus hydrophili]|uniref:ROK family protein n=1 Tax=Vagococcus hydrophili TaxID=2714947 RepID=A0A6G8AQT7_9ENTE|nr:ROK family protein [Vagococcus hydrophili]QIL47350.1 ROK family protein [Vagococcus hydrophili]
MGLVVFDIGGSAVKHGFWQDETLSEQAQFKTPETLKEMKEQMLEVIEAHKNKSVTGVGISSPGAVNVKERRIDGISAVPYLHHCPIFDELESYFALPVTIENDANCAGISEIELGAGKNATNAVFIVLGTGVGGSIFINRQIYKGSHLFGGELGLLVNDQETTLSSIGTIVKVANKYKELTGKEVNGKDIFELVENKDELAMKLLDDMYWVIAHALYNVQVSIDPELVIIGGGVSAREELPIEIGRRLQELLEKHLVREIMPEIKRCHYLNDANLVGAAMNFINLNK